MIKLEDVCKSYIIGKRKLPVLHDVNLHIAKGELVAIMGPSGSGKSTMLNLLGCLDVPTSGTYYLDGEETSCLGRKELARVRSEKIGFVFQSFNLLPRISALANVDLGLIYSTGSDKELALEALAKVGIEKRAHHRPTELSGGEQQRVAIARAIVKKPPLILADEPTGNLDSHASKEVISILTDLHHEQGMTLVMITHDPEVAHNCQRIIYINDGQVVKEETI